MGNYVMVARFRLFFRRRVMGFVARSFEVVVCCIRAYHADGSSLALAPSFTAPTSLDALGLIAALKTDNWDIDKFCKDGKWKSLLIVADNAVINRKIAKHLIAETEHPIAKKD